MGQNTDTKVVLKSLFTSLISTSRIGAAIVNALNEEQIANIEDTLRTHWEQIELLKEIVIGELYVNKERYLEDVKNSLQRAKDEATAEKRKLYATFLTACCHPDNSDCNNHRIFLDLVEKIDFLDLQILREFPLHPYSKEVNQLIRGFNGALSKNDMMIRLDYLISYRLIEQCSKDKMGVINKRRGKITPMHPERRHFYRKTVLGDNLYQFIKMGILEN
jgi:hypothetical protein